MKSNGPLTYDLLDYPHRYCTVQLAYYWTASVALMVEKPHKGGEFWLMLLHHLITVALLTINHFFNAYRIGSMVLLMHEISDVLLEVRIPSLLLTPDPRTKMLITFSPNSWPRTSS